MWISWISIFRQTGQLQVERGTGKVRRSKTDVLTTVQRHQLVSEVTMDFKFRLKTVSVYPLVDATGKNVPWVVFSASKPTHHWRYVHA